MLLLTLDAKIPCAHRMGHVDPGAQQSLVFIGGRPVLVRGDTLGRAVKRCLGGGPPLRPCKRTLREREGFSDFVHINGVPVLHSGLKGITDADPVGIVEYTAAAAGQSLVHTW
jgi:hypothetical protein